MEPESFLLILCYWLKGQHLPLLLQQQLLQQKDGVRRLLLRSLVLVSHRMTAASGVNQLPQIPRAMDLFLIPWPEPTHWLLLCYSSSYHQNQSKNNLDHAIPPVDAARPAIARHRRVTVSTPTASTISHVTPSMIQKVVSDRSWSITKETKITRFPKVSRIRSRSWIWSKIQSCL